MLRCSASKYPIGAYCACSGVQPANMKYPIGAYCACSLSCSASKYPIVLPHKYKSDSAHVEDKEKLDEIFLLIYSRRLQFFT